MQQVAARSKVSGLAAALKDLSRDVISTLAETQADPEAEQAAERTRLFENAVQEGLRRGELLAEQAVSERVAAIEQRLLAVHKAEVEALRTERQQLAKLIRSVPKALELMDQDVAASVAEVAFCAAARVIGQHWVEHDGLRHLCSVLIEEHRLSPATLRVAPEDVGRVSHATSDIRVVADDQLVPGQCVIESAKGRLITGLDMRMNAVRDALLDCLRSKS